VIRPGLGPYVNSHPSYVQHTTVTSQSDTSGYPASTGDNYYTVPLSGYYPSTTTRPDYGTSYSHDVPSPHSRIQYSSVPNTDSYATTTNASYYQNSHFDYSSPGSSSGYYPTSDYYTTTGDPAAFVGATSGEYYYVESDINDLPTTRS
jgi:hypothetical protein